MDLKVIGLARDLRTSTPVVYAQLAVANYLEVVGDEFENFSIQRRRESHKAYQRLKLDIKAGALLPSITLAVKPDKVSGIKPLFEAAERDDTHLAALSDSLGTAGNVDILDGLQRTYIMTDLKKEGHEFVIGQKVLVEFWLESDLKKLIYRIIVLNAGQKPMSIRHQLELLFMSLKTSVEQSIPGLEIYTERDNTRRNRPRKFPLSSIVSGYQAFITSSAELHKDNVIANQLIENSALDSSEEEISNQFSHFSATKHHHMAFSRYVSASNAFERFLRLYHNLELIFDFIIMKSIQKLGDDMVGFGTLSRAHGRTELDRLKYILVECCESWENIAAKFHGVVTFESKAAEIFQEHTKEGNPLDELRWSRVIEACQSGQTAMVNFTTAKLCKPNDYERFIASIAAYWIYRVRSSIAHSRVSEFLFEDSDEKFIVDFAERLLLEVVRQVLSSSKLASLIK